MEEIENDSFSYFFSVQKRGMTFTMRKMEGEKMGKVDGRNSNVLLYGR